MVRHDSGDTRLHAEPRHRQPILLRRRSRSSEPKEERRADTRPPSRPRHTFTYVSPPRHTLQHAALQLLPTPQLPGGAVDAQKRTCVVVAQTRGQG